MIRNAPPHSKISEACGNGNVIMLILKYSPQNFGSTVSGSLSYSAAVLCANKLYCTVILE